MPALDPAGCRAFVLERARPAMLATVRADGRPHVAPIWIDLDTDPETGDDLIVFNTGDTTVKGRNIAHDPRVALSIDDDQPPFTFVLAQGVAELSDDLAEVAAWAGRIGGRYMGNDRVAEYARRNGVPGELLVRVRVSSWTGTSAVAD